MNCALNFAYKITSTLKTGIKETGRFVQNHSLSTAAASLTAVAFTALAYYNIPALGACLTPTPCIPTPCTPPVTDFFKTPLQYLGEKIKYYPAPSCTPSPCKTELTICETLSNNLKTFIDKFHSLQDRLFNFIPSIYFPDNPEKMTAHLTQQVGIDITISAISVLIHDVYAQRKTKKTNKWIDYVFKTSLIIKILTKTIIGLAYPSKGETDNFYKDKVPKYLFLLSLCSYLVDKSDSIFSLIHEHGHALASKFLYPNSNPRIVINPDASGFCDYNLNDAKRRYPFLAKNWSKAIISAAGPALELLATSSVFSAALLLPKESPAREILLPLSLVNFFSASQYAFSALSSKKDNSHDYVRLKKEAGIHPLIPTICILASPILIQKAIG